MEKYERGEKIRLWLRVAGGVLLMTVLFGEIIFGILLLLPIIE